MNKVSILVVDVEDIFEHTEDKSWNGKHFAERTEADLFWDGNKQGNSQKCKQYPPFLTPWWHN